MIALIARNWYTRSLYSFWIWEWPVNERQDLELQNNNKCNFHHQTKMNALHYLVVSAILLSSLYYFDDSHNKGRRSIFTEKFVFVSIES